MGTAVNKGAVPAVASALGYCGLIPFVMLPLMMGADAGREELYARMLSSYSLSIVCFLVGIWWGLALIRRQPAALVLSNAVVIVAVLGDVVLPVGQFFVLSAALLAVTFAFEKSAALFRPQPPYYAVLRARLSVVACLALITAWAQV